MNPSDQWYNKTQFQQAPLSNGGTNVKTNGIEPKSY